MEQYTRLKTSLDRKAYLDTYLPLPHPSLAEEILHLLTVADIYKNDSWIDIPRSNKEEDIYKGLVKVLECIRAKTAFILPDIDRIPGKWVDTHDVALQTWSRSGVSGLRPDISFVYDQPDRNKIFWSRAYSVLEVKVSAGMTYTTTLAAQLGSYIGHIFAEQVDRLFVNALTLCDRKLQIFRYDRSGIVVLDKAIDIDQHPLQFVQIIASFSYLSPTDLGWDPTCMIWNTEEQVPQPSYKLPQQIFEKCGVYDLPWVFGVDKEEYVAIGPLNGNRSLSTWGRATFVVHAVELKDWKNRNGQAKVYVLKQCWQRLPGLVPAPKMVDMANGDNYTPDQPDRDSLVKDFGDSIAPGSGEFDEKPFEAVVMERAGWGQRVRASCFVKLEGKPISTFETIRKGAATSIPQQKSKSGTITQNSSSRTPGPLKTIDDAPNHPALVTRKLVRLVFDRPGWPIERFKSKLELLLSLKAIVAELETLHKNGIVHRDISPSNLIISDAGGHVIDFDHSKIAFVTEKVGFEKMATNNVAEIATKMIGSKQRARQYIFKLGELWDITDRVPNPKDFHWPEEIEPIYLFDDRRPGDGFVTGTYEFVSGYLPQAPYHHSGHDLDSLWWGVSVMPLRMDGPGDPKQENRHSDLIQHYYTGGPANKSDLWLNFSNMGSKLPDMMAEWSPYFKDLKPFMLKWASFLNIALNLKSYEYYHPHRYLIRIIEQAIKEMKRKKVVASEEAAEREEEARRAREKAYMVEAIQTQTTIPNLLKLKSAARSPVEEDYISDLLLSTAGHESMSGKSTTETSLSPEREPISLTTVDSPERDRAVKRARSGMYKHDTQDQFNRMHSTENVFQ